MLTHHPSGRVRGELSSAGSGEGTLQPGARTTPERVKNGNLLYTTTGKIIRSSNLVDALHYFVVPKFVALVVKCE